MFVMPTNHLGYRENIEARLDRRAAQCPKLARSKAMAIALVDAAVRRGANVALATKVAAAARKL